jgi:hypothetical protein
MARGLFLFLSVCRAYWGPSGVLNVLKTFAVNCLRLLKRPAIGKAFLFPSEKYFANLTSGMPPPLFIGKSVKNEPRKCPSQDTTQNNSTEICRCSSTSSNVLRSVLVISGFSRGMPVTESGVAVSEATPSRNVTMAIINVVARVIFTFQYYFVVAV